MKTTKRILAMALAIIMVMSLATTAFAAETQGTIINGTSRTYKAYQVFKGTQADGSADLGDIEWGNGIDSANFLTALQALEINDTTPFSACTTAAQAAELLAENASYATHFANLAENFVTGEGTIINANATVKVNSGYYVVIDQTSTTGEDAYRGAALMQVTNGSQNNISIKGDKPEVEKKVNGVDAVNANIGDTVTFTLTATLPSTFEGYESYKLVFHDTMSKGLTYVAISSVKVGNTTLTASQYTATNSTDATTGITTLTVTINDVLDYNPAVSSKVVVTYTAVLNENAVIGTEGNPNEVILEYSNDPQDEATTGKTPKDEVKVYTFDIPVFKYDGDSNEGLAGAKFSLKDSEGKVIKLTAKENNVYKVDPNGNVEVITTDTTGLFTIEGLKDGTYILTETEAPAGYNSVADITVVITEDGNVTVDGKTVDEVKVENNQGSVLPETGGVGTTMFYVFGAILMIGAAVLLVTKRRMSIAE